MFCCRNGMKSVGSFLAVFIVRIGRMCLRRWENVVMENFSKWRCDNGGMLTSYGSGRGRRDF